MEDSAGGSSPSSILHSPSSIFSSLLWSVFLACSWTWCIGMFLPVLLVRDYGVWGWVVFAIPNVIGAAAMGWVMHRVKDPGLFFAQHLFAVYAFSLATIAFHLFFMFWIIGRLIPGGPIWCLLAGASIFLSGGERGRRDLWAAVIVFAASLTAWMIFEASARPALLPPPGLRDLRELVGIAPICAFGFALCPYLDRTFQRAYRATGPHDSFRETNHDTSRLAFGLGFGVLFLLMIVFTLRYAPALVPVGEAHTSQMMPPLIVIGIHIVLQSGFTIAVHLRPTDRVFMKLVASSLLAVAMYGVGTLAASHTGRSVGEITYRLFIGFYGLVFPTYAWLCMVPTWRDPTNPSRRALGIFAAVVVLAAPFYWLGFIEQKTVWLLPGLGVVLLARLAIPRRRISS